MTPEEHEALRIRTQTELQRGADLITEGSEIVRRASENLSSLSCVNMSDIDVPLSTLPAFTRRVISTASHRYARAQVFNADETLLNLTGRPWGIYDLEGSKVYDSLLNSESCWHTTEPLEMFGIQGNAFFHVNVRTKKVTTLYQGSNKLFMGPSEGSVSDDNNRVVLVEGHKLLSFEIGTKQVVASRNLPERHDWTSFDRSGEFIVMQTDEYRVCFDKYFNELHRDETSRHSDFNFIDGEPVLVDTGTMDIWYLRSGKLESTPHKILGHISGRGPHGMVGYSTHRPNEGTPPPWSYGTIDLSTGGVTVWGTVQPYDPSVYRQTMRGSLSPSGKHFVYVAAEGATVLASKNTS